MYKHCIGCWVRIQTKAEKVLFIGASPGPWKAYSSYKNVAMSCVILHPISASKVSLHNNVDSLGFCAGSQAPGDERQPAATITGMWLA